MLRFALGIAQLILAAGLAGAQPAPDAPPAADCPVTMAASGLKAGESLACICTAEAANGPGVVWGTNRYTIDSYVCMAAIHAGATGPDGGPVTIHVGDTCTKFNPSDHNGRSSREYTYEMLSYAFVMPLPPCGTTGSKEEAAKAAELNARLAKDCAALGHSAAYCTCADERMEDTLTRDAALALYAVEDALVSGKPPADSANELAELLKESPVGVLQTTEMGEEKVNVAGTLAKLKGFADKFAAKLAETCHD